MIDNFDHNSEVARLSPTQQIEIAMAVHLGTLADALINVLDKDWYLQAMAGTAEALRDSAAGRVASYIHGALELGSSEKRPFEVIIGGLADSDPKSEKS